MKNILGVILPCNMFYMCKSGQFYLYPTWMIPLRSARMGDISIFFFKKIVGVANMRYFNAQQVALDHRVEEREINHALHDDDVVQMEGDANDLALRDVQ